MVSEVSAWEAAAKIRIGKLVEATLFVADPITMLEGEVFIPLPISVKHGKAREQLAGLHRDPFARILIIQAQLERSAVIKRDVTFQEYLVECIR